MSPILAHTNATIQGLSTIRSFKAQQHVEDELNVRQDLLTSTIFSYFGSAIAFAFWLDVVNITYISIVIMSFLVFENLDDPYLGGSVGVAISQAIGLMGFCQWGIRKIAQLQNHLIAVDRVKEYSNLPPEASWTTKMQTSLADWPQSGQIRFDNLSLRYSPYSQYILKKLNFTINPKVCRFFKINYFLIFIKNNLECSIGKNWHNRSHWRRKIINHSSIISSG